MAQIGARMRATAPKACCTPSVWPSSVLGARCVTSADVAGYSSAVPMGNSVITSARVAMFGASGMPAIPTATASAPMRMTPVSPNRSTILPRINARMISDSAPI